MEPKGKFVTPKTYMLGCTGLSYSDIDSYLRDTGQEEFQRSLAEAIERGANPAECLISFYAKLCYASLVPEKNLNLNRVRDIEGNLHSVVESGHGSVLEHVSLNFVTTSCSRVFTHELVRHRVGTAYSQTSGRYVRSDCLDLVIDPILSPINEEIKELQAHLEDWYDKAVEKLGLRQDIPFTTKKKLTSALRRLLPNGQSNEIGFSVNVRSLRHLIELRTSPHAEWEVRVVFNQVFDLVVKKFPILLFDAVIGEPDSDGLRQITFANSKV